MKRFFKIFGLIFLTLVVIIAGIIIYIVATVDLEQIKQQISENVKKETGRELQIKGDLDLSVFPWIGVEIGETHFGNAAGFAGDFASFSHARASLKLMPLFSKQVEMSTLDFDDFSLNLHQRKDGINNWDDLAKKEQPAAGKPAAKTPEEAGALAFFLEGVEIRNANLSFQDDQAGSTFALTNFNLTAGQIGLQRDIPFSVDFKISLSDPQVAGDYRIQGVANLDPNAGLFKVRDVRFDSNLNTTGLPVESVALGLTANLAFDHNRMQLEAKPFDLKATVKGEAIPNRSADLSVSTVLAFDAKAMTATLKPLTIGIPGGKIQGEVAYAQKGKLQQIDFDLTADQIDVNRLVAPAPEASSGEAAKQPAGQKLLKNPRPACVTCWSTVI
jgi:AsmA protein